jgi:type II secretory pathway pseudopilin PulG
MKAERGLSLLELLVAMGLLLLVLTTVIVPIQSARRSSQRAQGRVEALRLAQELLSQARLSPQTVPSQRVGSEQVSLRVGQAERVRVYTYDLRLSAVEPGLTRADLTLRWQTGEIAYQTLIYGLKP